MDLLAKTALAAVSAAFISGLLLGAVTGSTRAVKVFIAIVAGTFLVGIVAGLVFSKGLLVYLLFQIITLVLFLIIAIVLGAVCGGGVYLLLHRKPAGQSLSTADIENYLPATQFCALEGITEERALARIRSGYYRGGLHEGVWYIHKTEQSQQV